MQGCVGLQHLCSGGSWWLGFWRGVEARESEIDPWWFEVDVVTRWLVLFS